MMMMMMEVVFFFFFGMRGQAGIFKKMKQCNRLKNKCLVVLEDLVLLKFCFCSYTPFLCFPGKPRI